MNANELADELDDYYIAITDEYTGFGYLKEAATMLRQQQADLKIADEAHDILKRTVKEQQAEIEALHLELDETHKRMILQQDEIEVNKYGYELGLNIKIEELKEKDVCLKLLHDRIAHLNKMVVYYQDISMSGTHSEEYEEGFWDAVDFVKKVQEK